LQSGKESATQVGALLLTASLSTAVNAVKGLMRDKPNSTHVAGFNTWKELGRWVKSDEKGISVLARSFRRQPDVRIAAQDCPGMLNSARNVVEASIPLTNRQSVPAIFE
jgi:hypothetical protein